MVLTIEVDDRKVGVKEGAFMKKDSIRNCPICEEVKSDILHTQRFVLPEGHPLSDGYDVVCCTRCGLVYADTTASQEDYDNFYAKLSKYEDNQTATGGGESPCDSERLQKTAECIAEFLPNKSVRILDIGCANGGLLGYLKKLGYNNLTGIDPSPVCTNNTIKLYGVEAHVGSLFIHRHKLGQFDCVILSHVLEHIHNVRLAIECLYELIKIGGCVYLEVPNASLYADYVVAPFQDFNTEHINHFSHTSLSNLLKPLGFSCKASGEKVFESSPGMPYPAIYSFWRKEEQKLSEFIQVRDSLVKERLEEYIYKSKKIMDDIDINLQSILRDMSEIIVWGTGQLAMKLLAETSLGKVRIAAFVDGNPINKGKVLSGTPILEPEQIRGMKQPIVVTSILHQQAIADKIAKMNIHNRVILLG